MLVSVAVALFTFLSLRRAVVLGSNVTGALLVLGAALVCIGFYLAVRQVALLMKESQFQARKIHDLEKRSILPEEEVGIFEEHIYNAKRTGNHVFDEMVRKYQRAAARADVDFLVYTDMTAGEIEHLVSLYTYSLFDVAGNLIDNAFKAVERACGGDVSHRVMVCMGENAEGVFEMAVSDTAGYFPVHILNALGEENNTTGGSGYGYLSVLDFARRYGAKLVIQQDRAALCPFSKSVRIVFCGKYGVDLITDDTDGLAPRDKTIMVYKAGAEKDVCDDERAFSKRDE